MAEQKYKNGLVERLEIHKNSQTEQAEKKYKNGLIERLENHKNDQAEQTEYKYKGIKRQSRPKRNSRKRICRETHKVEGTKVFRFWNPIFCSKKVWPYVVIGTIITFLFYFSREIDFMENCNFAATKTTKFWVR